AALGGVDDAAAPLAAGGEVTLELLQVDEELFLGVHGMAVDVGDFAEDGAAADDAFPLFGFQGAKAAEFHAPGFVDGGAGLVVEAIDEAKVLADEDDGVAAEEFGEVEGEVGDGGA